MKTILVLSSVLAMCMAATDVTDDMVARHNKDRSRHQAGPLASSDKLIGIAKACADRNAKRDKIAHDCPQQKGFGENLAWSMSSAGSPSEEDATAKAYNGWYGEIKNYIFKTGTSNGNGATGHFTQVVWNGTKEVGCAYAKNVGKKSAVVACAYNPPGNYQGEYVNNVFPASD